MVRVLSDAAVADLLSLPDLLDVVAGAFREQYAGAVERPERPHFPVGTGLDPDDPDRALGTGLVMPAYVHGADHYATKLVSVHEGNPDRGLPTVNAQIVLAEAATGRPAAVMAGNRITNARTGCIGGLAARHLAAAPVEVGVLGAGTQARWQARAAAAATDVAAVRVYSPSGSKHECAAELDAALAPPVEAAPDPESAVAGADVVVTATTSGRPVFPGEALAEGALVVAVGAYAPGMRELDGTTMERAARVFADVPAEVAAVGDVADAGLDAGDLVPFGAVLSGDAGRDDPDDVIVVESVGSAVLDAATAEYLFERAVAADAGTEAGL